MWGLDEYNMKETYSFLESMNHYLCGFSEHLVKITETISFSQPSLSETGPTDIFASMNTGKYLKVTFSCLLS